MPVDQFGPKKPSICPYGYLAISLRWGPLKEKVTLFREKNSFSFWPTVLTRSHLFLISWIHMKAVTCGYMVKVKNVEKINVFASQRANIAPKIAKITKYMGLKL